MTKDTLKRPLTDDELKHKSVKMVVTHLKKKVSKEFVGSEHIKEWVEEMDQLLGSPEFNVKKYFEMRKKLNDIIEQTLDEEIRFKLRDSWYSFGKALDKKVR